MVVDKNKVEGATRAEMKEVKESLLEELQELGVVKEVTSAMALLKIK